MEYKEFKTAQAAAALIAELDAKNGYPKKGDTTKTTAGVEVIASLYYVKSEGIRTDINTDLSKVKTVEIIKTLSDKLYKEVKTK